MPFGYSWYQLFQRRWSGHLDHRETQRHTENKTDFTLRAIARLRGKRVFSRSARTARNRLTLLQGGQVQDLPRLLEHEFLEILCHRREAFAGPVHDVPLA
jgi:hypothetical protein